MKTYCLKTFFGAAVLLSALSAICQPQNSGAQTRPVPPDNAGQPSAPATFPTDILPTSPLAQVIKLTQAGVSEDVIMTYIANSDGKFNLNADKIIYLSDIGIPDKFVNAMIQ